MHVKKGDKVKILAGRDKNLGPATVLKVDPVANRVVVEGRNLVRKHIKGSQLNGGESRIEEVEAPVHASNVALWSDKANKPVRTQARYLGEGGSLHTSRAAALASFPTPPERVKKVRYCAATEEVFE